MKRDECKLSSKGANSRLIVSNSRGHSATRSEAEAAHRSQLKYGPQEPHSLSDSPQLLGSGHAAICNVKLHY